MNETIFGSGTPVWTAMPSIGLAYQPMNVSNRPIAPPLFSSTAIPGGIGGALTGAGLSAQQNLAGSGYVAPYPFASPAPALPGHDTNGWVTATFAADGRRPTPWTAARAGQRSRGRGLHLRRARLAPGNHRCGSPFRERPCHADGRRAAQTHQTGRRRNRVGASRSSGCPEQRLDHVAAQGTSRPRGRTARQCVSAEAGVSPTEQSRSVGH